MPGLMELALTEEISVRGKKITLHPVSVDDILDLLSRFPSLVRLLTSGGSADERVKIATDIGAAALAHLIACSAHELDNPAAVEQARRIGVGKQLEIVEKIIDITFEEEGTGPFVDRLARVFGGRTESEPSESQSSDTWSASLVGDAPRPPRARPRLVNSARG